MPIFHSLTATTPDNTSYEIRPSHWNESHVVVLNASEVIKWASAGTNSISSGTMVFANSNNVTFGMDTSGIITASASMAAGAGDGYNILAAGTQTAGTAATVAFNNANGITFGMSNSSVITASHNGLTTAMASNRGSDFVQATAAFAGTSASGTIASNGLSISIGPYITTAMLSNAATISNIKVSAGTLSSNRSDITFGNSNGITFGLETNGVITGTVETNYAVSTHSHGNPTLALTNLTGTTASASNGLTISLSAAAPGGGAENTHSTLIPYFPYATSTRTCGAMGVSTGSIHLFPLSLEHAVAFNELRMQFSNSHATSNVSGRQTVTWNFGLYSRNGTNLSLISSNSLSFGVTNSSVSATVGFPTSTATSGYGYGTIGMTATAQIQSLFGTAGNRYAGLQFGGNVTLTEGLYWLAFHQRQSSTSANVGFNSALLGAIMYGSGFGLLGSSTLPFATNVSYNWGWGVFTSTNSAGHSGTALFNPIPISGISQQMNVMPLITLIST